MYLRIVIYPPKKLAVGNAPNVLPEPRGEDHSWAAEHRISPADGQVVADFEEHL